MSSATASSHSDGSAAGNVFAQVNAYRGSIGRQPLVRDPNLDRLAREHSEFMLANRGKFTLGGKSSISHYGFEERALYAQRAMNMQNVAENVAFASGSNPIPRTIQGWKDSSGHDFNMKGDWACTGVGVAVDKDGSVFSTQIFATKNNSLMTMRDRLRQF